MRSSHHLVRLITLSCLLLLAPLPCRALMPEYLREWPDLQLVIQDILFGDIAPRFFRGLAMAAIAAGIWFLLSRAIAALRRRRFQRDELPRFSQLIDDRDAAPADPGTAP